MTILSKVKRYLFTHDNNTFDYHKAFNFLKYIGPGLLVTVGFIDPGN